jgi:pimeloyl-ACP methyl ester carboxylesterase
MQLEIISRLPSVETRKTPLLFVHGSWHAAWCWDVHFLDFFARNGFPAYAVSLRGHGGSEGHAGLRCTTVKEFVTDIASAANQLPARPVVIGHSLGGYLVQRYIEDYPVSAAVLLSSMPLSGGWRNGLRLAVHEPWAFVKANLAISMYPFVATPKLARRGLFSSGLSDQKVHEYWEKLQDESVLVFLQLIFGFAKKSRNKAPVLVAGGELDAVVYQDQFDSTARLYGTTAKKFPDTAHDVMLEPRWEAVAAYILEWLNLTLEPHH